MFVRFSLISLVLLCFAPVITAQDILIEDIEIRGNRRLPKDTLLYSIQSKVNDPFREEAVRRDFEALLNLGFFDPLKCRVLTGDGPKGGKIIVFEVKEYPIIRALTYRGLKSTTESELFTKFKERRVSVTKETQFDPGKLNGARQVLREALAEKGHPNAKIDLEIEEINQTSIGLIFNIDEGPRVRIKEIVFTGAGDKFSQQRLKGAMKVVKESGLLSSFQSKDIYFKPKLEYDLENVRQFLGSKGYLNARIGEPVVEDAGKVTSGIPIPLPDLPKLPKLRQRSPGLRITVPVEVGRRYKIKTVKEDGVNIFQPGLITAVSGLKVGDYANAETIRRGVYEKDGIKGLYGDRGYINASAELEPVFTELNEEEGEVEFTIRVEEGKQYTLRRLEFIGNTNTRDRVLRREVLVNEGDAYSKRYWDLSILRLNQLGLFEEIKEKDALTRTNDRTQEVDVDVQVKERGRQSINMNGGVSGITGTFFGIGYSTNNLFGYGQSLSINVAAGTGQSSVSVGITEPWFLGKPISLGVNLFAQRQRYFRVGTGFANTFSTADYLTLTQGGQGSILGGLQDQDQDQLFTQNLVGASLDFSAPLSILTRRFKEYGQFTRVGLSYSAIVSNNQDPKVNRDDDKSNDIPVSYSQPTILTSRLTPTLFYNTLNSSLDPTRGKSLSLSLGVAGGWLGGDVNLLSPSLDFKYFKPVARKYSELAHVFGFHFAAQHARTFGKVSDKIRNTQSLAFIGNLPVTDRYFLGGDYDVRGYNPFSISPTYRYDYYRSTQNVVAKVLNSAGDLVDVQDGSVHSSVARAFTFDSPDGACSALRGLSVPRRTSYPKSANCNVERIIRYDADDEEVPFYTAVGGDTKLVINAEYRIPLHRMLSVVGFFDAGAVFNLRKYSDQIITSNFTTEQNITPQGVVLNSSGTVATRHELDSAIAAAGNNLTDGLPAGFRRVYMQGDTRSYNILQLSQGGGSFWNNTRISMGVEIRVQVPMLNVPFRLIFAQNPNANTDISDPRLLLFERKSNIRFSVGRTF